MMEWIECDPLPAVCRRCADRLDCLARGEGNGAARSAKTCWSALFRQAGMTGKAAFKTKEKHKPAMD